ncbi:reprolysin-like metallopeptidase [Hymenobacter ruber]
MNFRYGKVSFALVVSLLLGARVGSAQTPAPLWQPAPAPAARNGNTVPKTAGSWFALDAPQLAARLASAPPETRPTAAVTLELPYPDGTLHRFALTKVPVMAPDLAARYPQIQTYAGHGLDEPTASVRLETSPAGLHAQVLDLTSALSIDADPGTANRYQSHPEALPEFACQALPVPGRAHRPTGGTPPAPPAPYGSQLRVLRLALATTGEFYRNSALGNNDPVTTTARLVTLVNALNAVYERELAVRLELIGNNDLLIYTDPATDPYTNSNPGTMIDESRASINTVIGSANYDIGHVLGYLSGGYSGVAYVGVTCFDPYKGGGASTGATPSLMAAVVTHEMGHQLGSEHTFNGDKVNCSGGNRSPSLAYEPGAGNTIMSYDSRCAPDNVGPGINYFHAGSLSAIASSLGTACGSFTATGNQPPSVSVPPSNTYTIPLGTPFTLTGSGTDPNGDALTYSWEELDLGNASGLAGAATDASGPPLFRSFAPVASPARTFPNLTSLLANTASLGEILPQVARTLNFRLTARDNHSGVAGANVTLAVAAAGPFAVTAPSAAFSATGGSNYALTWSVLGTDQAPVNCTNVQVLFSTDGGLTFPTVLLASTPNDGTQSVQLPNVNTSQGRIKIQALNNVFFAINNANITLTASLPVELTDFTAEAHGPTAHLNWHTASEKNNAGFAIETSNDGTEFHRLGWVAGQGSSTMPHSYQFDDAALATYPGPTVYYRLRQLDNNGPESLSPVRAVAVTTGALARLQVWPNPASGTVTVAGLAAGQQVQVLDLAGRVRLAATQAGRGALQLELSALPPGLYVVRGNGSAVRLMVK